MPAPEFLDTSVLVYAYDPGDSRKRRIAQDLVRRALAGDILVSTQVLAEFAATLLHKMRPAAHPKDVAAVRSMPWVRFALLSPTPTSSAVPWMFAPNTVCPSMTE
jgi:predicted nucleic acid-binding protein